MILSDIKLLTSVLRDAEPGIYQPATAHAAWAAVCATVAAELRKRNAVTDHTYDEAVFLEAALGHGDYDVTQRGVAVLLQGDH